MRGTPELLRDSFRRRAMAPAAALAFLLGALPLAAQPPSEAAPPPSGRPNILFLFADDQRADTVGAWGNERIDTPSLDRLAAEGFSFRRNYTFGSNSGAVCVPSRAMVLTGRSWMRSPNDMRGVPTLPRRLEAAGYRTFITGKWHNGEEALLRSFDRGTAVYLGGMADHTRVGVQDIEDGELVRRRVGQAFSSELFADAVIAFLGEQAASAQGDEADRPFFAYVPFMAPHDPRQPPPEYRERYYRRDLPLPANYMPQHPFDHGVLSVRDENLAAWPRTPEVIRDQLAEYYGLITHLDEQVGRILAALEENGQAGNTVVVYAADHGLGLGSHGLLGKQNLYEHSMRCPLIVRGPGIPHGLDRCLHLSLRPVPDPARPGFRRDAARHRRPRPGGAVVGRGRCGVAPEPVPAVPGPDARGARRTVQADRLPQGRPTGSCSTSPKIPMSCRISRPTPRTGRPSPGSKRCSRDGEPRWPTRRRSKSPIPRRSGAI